MSGKQNFGGEHGHAANAEPAHDTHHHGHPGHHDYDLLELIRKEAIRASYRHGVPGHIRHEVAEHATAAAFEELQHNPTLIHHHQWFQEFMLDETTHALLHHLAGLVLLERAQEKAAAGTPHLHSEDLIRGLLASELAHRVHEMLHEEGLSHRVISEFAHYGKTFAARIMVEEARITHRDLGFEEACTIIWKACHKVRRHLPHTSR